MRTGIEGALLLLALAGCHVENVALDYVPPTPPAKGSYGACGAAPTALAHLPGLLPLLAIDPFDLYTATAADDGSPAQRIWRVPKDGSPPVTIATSPTAITSLKASIWFNGGYWSGMVWTSAGDPEGGPGGAVWALGLNAGDEASVVAANRASPVAAVSTANQVYWAEQGVDDGGNSVEAIMSVPITGGAPRWIQSVPSFEAPTKMALWVGGSMVDGSPEFFDEGALYWTTASPASSAEIVASPLSGPFEPVARFGGLDAGGAGGINVTPWGIEVSVAGAIATIEPGPDGGAGAPRNFFLTSGPVEVFDDDGVSLYFVQPGTTDLVAAPYNLADGGPPRTLLTGVAPTLPLRVDSTCVYFVDPSTGDVTMVAK
jgi:hypothetical protein